jgi:hypothetical protein
VQIGGTERAVPGLADNQVVAPVQAGIDVRGRIAVGEEPLLLRGGECLVVVGNRVVVLRRERQTMVRSPVVMDTGYVSPMRSRISGGLRRTG